MQKKGNELHLSTPYAENSSFLMLIRGTTFPIESILKLTIWTEYSISQNIVNHVHKLFS